MLVSLSLLIATQSVVLDGEKSSTELNFQCLSTEDRRHLEIGEHYVFARRAPSFRKRTLIGELTLYIRRRSQLSDEGAAKLGLNDDKIGALGFYPAYKGSDEFEHMRRASLEAFAFVDDTTFNGLLSSVQLGARSIAIQINIDHKETLKYGWEPDGSRMEWRIEKPEEPAYVDVTQVRLDITLFEASKRS